MAGSPRVKIYDRSGKTVASVEDYTCAAVLVGICYTDGGTIKYDHSGPVLWTEGAETFSAATSYDGAAAIMAERRHAWLVSKGYVNA